MAHVTRRTSLAGLRALLYGRASHDPKRLGTSIRDQFADAEAECAEREWTIAGYYEDRDRSATRYAKKQRKDWERLLVDAAAGAGDVIMYAERSRAARDLEVGLKLRRLCEETDILLCYDGRVYDMRIPSDRREFTRDLVAAEEEGEGIASRNARTARLSARRGAPAPGVPALGYRRRYDPATGRLLGQEEDPTVGPDVLQFFTDVSEGKTVYSAVEILRKHRPDITLEGARAILRNKTYIGIRKHGKEEHKGNWDALVPETKFWKVQEILDDPDRRNSHSSVAAHLLTGRYFACSICRGLPAEKRGKMRAKDQKRRAYVIPMYECTKGHMGVTRASANAYVEEALLRWIGSPAARAALTPVDSTAELHRARVQARGIAEQLAEARRNSTQFDDDGRPLLSSTSLGEMERELLPKLDVLTATIRRLTSAGNPLLDQLLGAADEDELDLLWNHGLMLEQQRYVLGAVMRVELQPAVTFGRAADVSRRIVVRFAETPASFKDWPISG